MLAGVSGSLLITTREGAACVIGVGEAHCACVASWAVAGDGHTAFARLGPRTPGPPIGLIAGPGIFRGCRRCLLCA